MWRKFLILYTLIASLIFVVAGCRDSKNADWRKYSRETIEHIINQPVKMPDSIPVCYPDCGAYMQLMQSKVKVVFSVDISCSTCLSKLNYWNWFVERVEQKYRIKAPVLAVICAPRCNEETIDFVNKRWHHEWIYDPEGDFTFNNELDDDRFQAILLDANDTIRLVGNPVFNESLGRLYEKAIVERLR